MGTTKGSSYKQQPASGSPDKGLKPKLKSFKDVTETFSPKNKSLVHIQCMFMEATKIGDDACAKPFQEQLESCQDVRNAFGCIPVSMSISENRLRYISVLFKLFLLNF
jgi:hypothetical protein